jgi:hypothetical protein
MNLRHAAALALVGWYLITAPLTDDSRADLGAPLSTWHVWRRFDSVQECEKMRKTVRGAGEPAESSEQYRSPESVEPKLGLRAAQCIATDDPRLKEK